MKYILLAIFVSSCGVVSPYPNDHSKRDKSVDTPKTAQMEHRPDPSNNSPSDTTRNDDNENDHPDNKHDDGDPSRHADDETPE